MREKVEQNEDESVKVLVYSCIILLDSTGMKNEELRILVNSCIRRLDWVGFKELSF